MRTFNKRTVAVTLAAVACVATPASAAGPRQVIGGTTAADNSWPSIARIEVDLHNGYVSLCGGTVISPEWVVTAAHCAIDDEHAGRPPYRADQFTVITGRHDLSTHVGQELGVRQVIVNPAYDRYALASGSDVALLHLSQPTAARPMRVATAADAAANRYFTPDGVPNLAGWGWTLDEQPDSAPDRLQEVYAKLQSNATCAQADEPAPPAFEPESMLCAGTPGKTSCHGDSGGPVVVFARDTGEPVLYGIVSWGNHCGKDVTYHGRVTAFGEFLEPGLPVPPEPEPEPQPQPETPTTTPSVTPPAPAPTAPAATPAPPRDVIAPHLSKIRIPGVIRVSGRVARKNIVLRMRTDERTWIVLTLKRRGAHGRLQRVKGTYRAALVPGGNRIVLPRNAWRLKPGSYRLELRATDASGNRVAFAARLRMRR